MCRRHLKDGLEGAATHTLDIVMAWPYCTRPDTTKKRIKGCLVEHSAQTTTKCAQEDRHAESEIELVDSSARRSFFARHKFAFLINVILPPLSVS